MIEEIKKELLKLNIHECDIEDVFEILNKHDNQSDYKSAWNELKNQPTNYITHFLDKFGFVDKKTLNKLIEELEQKYKLGGE